MRVPAWQVGEPTVLNALPNLVLVPGHLLPTVDVRDLYSGFALVDRLTPVELPACGEDEAMLCVRCNWPLEGCQRRA